MLKDVISDQRRKAGIAEADSISRKAAAIEAHTLTLAGRNTGVVGVGALVLTIVVSMINTFAASITGILGVAALAWMIIARIKYAQYLEQKYNLEPKPLFPKRDVGFKV